MARDYATKSRDAHEKAKATADTHELYVRDPASGVRQIFDAMTDEYLDGDDIDDLIFDYGYDIPYSHSIEKGEYLLADAIADAANDKLGGELITQDFEFGDFDPSEARDPHGRWGEGG